MHKCGSILCHSSMAKPNAKSHRDVFLSFRVPVNDLEKCFHHATGHQCFDSCEKTTRQHWCQVKLMSLQQQSSHLDLRWILYLQLEKYKTATQYQENIIFSFFGLQFPIFLILNNHNSLMFWTEPCTAFERFAFMHFFFFSLAHYDRHNYGNAKLENGWFSHTLALMFLFF